MRGTQKRAMKATMNDDNKIMEKLCGLINDAQKIALFTHLSPDGDAMGSILALSHALRGLGKSCDAYCEDPAPEKYAFLPGCDDIITESGNAGEYDLAIAVDAADELRLGVHEEFFSAVKKTACIDHHGTNSGYAHLNLIDPARASASELVLSVIDALGVGVTQEIGMCLFVGVSTDTFHFSFNNTTRETLFAASRMVSPGMDMDALTGLLYRFRPLAKTRLIGQVLSGLKVHSGGRIVTMTSTEEERLSCGAIDEDYEGIINYGIESYGVHIAVLARSANDGNDIKVSFRSKGAIDVAALAASYGGGGHRNAAGCTVRGADIESVISDITEKAKGLLVE